jgi:cellulose synthase/poly-beta-1,6-N-acetylglucosamine synthase-like glycosyltransferase
MIELVLLCSLAFFTLYYVYFITRIRIGLFALRPSGDVHNRPFVTVVIAARNEEPGISQCLQSLVQQSYPAHNYEIIIVDDGSTDNTASIVKTFSEKYPSIHLLASATGREHESSRKPFAITQGIGQARGEIILTTDADCIAPPRWIEYMAGHFLDDVVFVAGPVVVRDTPRFINKLERLEFLGLITTAAGLIGTGRPIICNGANLGYRKSSFNAVNGFGDNATFNDDESLMNRMLFRKIGRIVFASDAEAVIETRPSESVISFLKQRIRWANKQGRYEDKTVFMTLVSLYLFFLILMCNFLFIPFEQQLLLPVVIVCTGKACIDYFLLRAGAKMFRQRLPFLYFAIAELFHVPYIVLAAAIGQCSSIRWKGRTVRR